MEKELKHFHQLAILNILQEKFLMRSWRVSDILQVKHNSNHSVLSIMNDSGDRYFIPNRFYKQGLQSNCERLR